MIFVRKISDVAKIGGALFVVIIGAAVFLVISVLRDPALPQEQEADGEIRQLTATLPQVDVSIVSDTVWQSLTGHGTLPTAENSGRANPFLPTR